MKSSTSKIFVAFLLVGTFALTNIAFASTTIGTDISTGGNLTVTGTATIGPDESTLNPLIQGYTGGNLLGTTIGGTGLGFETQEPASSGFGVVSLYAVSLNDSDTNYSKAIEGDALTSFAGGQAAGVSGFARADGAITADSLYALEAMSPVLTNGASVTNNFGLYISDQSNSGITNNYYSWFDSRGVRRVKEDNTFNSVEQAIEALYNPLFTKYTPGATDYERVVLGQWNSNIAEIGAQAGGTGTLRPLRLIGSQLYVPGHLNSSTTNSDLDGTITLTSATSASHTFATAFNSNPVCVIVPTTDPTSLGAYWVTISTTAITANVHTSGSITFNYHCVGNPN